MPLFMANFTTLELFAKLNCRRAYRAHRSTILHGVDVNWETTPGEPP